MNFKGQSLDFVKVNGTDLSPEENVFRKNKIFLPVDLLQEDNTIDVRFTGVYRKDGAGLHYYVDPDDDEVYLYTQFEPFYANKCFPCFDQPDIKATMTLYSFSHWDWKVISNEFESDTTNSTEIYTKMLEKIGCPVDVAVVPEGLKPDDQDVIFRRFSKTAKISTYLYAFIVGPYVSEKNNAPNAKNYVPMRIIARKSIMKHVKTKEMFKVTMAGFDYYENFFDCKYPFKKYDQIFCPEFNAGAMENVGCVTFSERVLNRGSVITKTEKEEHAITVLHELAHMWFGDLVTMRWWDDLWLNESFATFMSHMSLEYAKGLEDYSLSWELFLSYKSWGLRTDQFSTTHPIAADCATTEDAENIFDGISYGKGAAFLKQLVAYVSEEVFRLGVGTYFKKYAYLNTELNDLITEIQLASDSKHLNIDLRKWCDTWIKTSGFNIFESKLKESGGAHSRITDFKIFQSLSLYGDNCYREQYITVALFDDNFKISEKVKIKIDAKEETTVDKLIGKPAPKAYLLNYEDWGYGMFLIDERSLEAFKAGLCFIQDSLSRKLIHNTIFFMARDAKISSKTFAQFLKSQIIHESSQDIVEDQILYNANVILKNYTPEEFVVAECNDMMHFLLYDFIPIATSEELKETILKGIISLACTEDHFKLMMKWIESNEVSFDKEGIRIQISDLIISPEIKYSMLRKIATSTELSAETIRKFYETHLENDDNKDLVKSCKLSCEAAIYDKASKEKFWNMVMSEKPEISLYDQEAIMRTFMPRNQKAIIEPYVNRFFEDIPKVFRTRECADRDSVFYMLSPTYFGNHEILGKYRKLIEDNQDSKSLILRVKEDIERIEKYIRGRELYNHEIKDGDVSVKLQANM